MTTPNRLFGVLGADAADHGIVTMYAMYAPKDLRGLSRPAIHKCRLLGIGGDAETQAYELARLAWVRLHCSSRSFRLHRLLPEGAKRRNLSSNLPRRRSQGKGSR